MAEKASGLRRRWLAAGCAVTVVSLQGLGTSAAANCHLHVGPTAAEAMKRRWPSTSPGDTPAVLVIGNHQAGAKAFARLFRTRRAAG